MKLWIIGAGGLFGSALLRNAAESGWTPFLSNPIPWNDPEETIKAITTGRDLFSEALTQGEPCAIAWAAGRATTSSSQAEADLELSVFMRSLEVLRNFFVCHPGGRFLLASSAGGVYAGSDNPPFSSSTTPKPIGVYGHLKLDQELATQGLDTAAEAVIIARLANLYGTGQDLSKQQGLVSRLALVSITNEPVTMFVPLDTLRDFIHADDAAKSSLHWLTTSTQGTHVRVIASGRAVTLGYVITQMKDITKATLPVAYGFHPSAKEQARDLRLQPDTDADAQKQQSTPLPVGIRGVYEDLLMRHQLSRTKAD